jgi:hypothetical protein
MSTPDFEAIAAAEDVERYFASTSVHTEFVHWMQRIGRPAPDGEIKLDASGNVSMERSDQLHSRPSACSQRRPQ